MKLKDMLGTAFMNLWRRKLRAILTVLGMVIERTAYKPLRQASSLAVLITAIGMSYLCLLYTSPSPRD